MKIFFLFLICLTFQACDSGSKKTAVISSTSPTKNTITKSLAKAEETNNISKTENSSELTNQVKTVSNLKEWKKELSEKLKPIPLTSPTASQTKISSTIKEKISAKDAHKTEMTMANKSERYKLANPTKELDLSEENNFGKKRKVESEIK